MSSKAFKAGFTVYAAGKSRVTTADELRLDPNKNILSVGRLKLKICDLIKPPSVSNGNVSFVSQRHRVVAPSTPETRDLLDFVTGVLKQEQTDRRTAHRKEQPSISRIGTHGDHAGGINTFRAQRQAGSENVEPNGAGGNVGGLAGGEGAKSELTKARWPTASSPISASGNMIDKQRISLFSPSVPNSGGGYKPYNTLHRDSRPSSAKKFKRPDACNSNNNNNNNNNTNNRAILNLTSGNASVSTAAGGVGGGGSGGGGGGSRRRGRQMVDSAVKPRGSSAVTGGVLRGNFHKVYRGKSANFGRGNYPSLDMVKGCAGSGIVNRSAGGNGSGDEGPSGVAGWQAREQPSQLQQRSGEVLSAPNALRNAAMGLGDKETSDEELDDGLEELTSTPPRSENNTLSVDSPNNAERTGGPGPLRRNHGRKPLCARTYNKSWPQGQFGRYVVHRGPVHSRREGFLNMGNTCYINACLQGLLSLNAFVGDLQYKCWVRAMLPGGNDDEVSSVLRTAATKRQRSERPCLYETLLLLSFEARKSHGVMDATPLKKAMDRHSDRFAGNLQQDAHEFLSDLINVLHEETHPRLDAAAASVPPKTSDVDGLIALLIESNKTTATNITNTTDDKKGGGRVEDDDGVTTRANSPQSGVVDLSCCEISRDEGLLPRAVGDGDGSGGLCEGEKVVDGDGYVRKDHNSTSGGGSGGDRRAALGEAKGVGALKSGGGGDGAHDDTSGEAKAEQVVGRIPPGEGKEAEAAAAAIKERFMPTTRHFHSELEVTLTCTRCAYSRRRRELYRDFSLDIPERPLMGREVSNLDDLLEGFFRPTELNLKCERCNHDTVRAEHAVAALPGTLILHIKRFKPVATPLALPRAPMLAAPATDRSGLQAAIEGQRSCDRGEGGRGSGSLSGDDVAGSSSSCFSGVSYVKMMDPVAVTRELDLGRFCTEFTENAPADDLGQRVESLEAVGIPSKRPPFHDVTPPSLHTEAHHNAANNGRRNNHHGDDGDTEHEFEHEVNGGGAGSSRNNLDSSVAQETGYADAGSGRGSDIGLKRCAEISVDLSLREGWNADGEGQKRGYGNENQKHGMTKVHRGGRSDPLDLESSPDPCRFPSPTAGAGSGSRFTNSYGGKRGDDSCEMTSTSEAPGTAAGRPGGRVSLGLLSDNAITDMSTITQRRQGAKERRSKMQRLGATDRWAHQENLSKAACKSFGSSCSISSSGTNNNIRCDSDGNIDYLQTLSRSAADDDRIWERRPGSGSGGRVGGANRVNGRSGGWAAGNGDGNRALLRGGLACGGLRLKRPMPERNSEERKQLEAAIVASRAEADSSPYSRVDDQSPLGLALRPSQEDMDRGQEEATTTAARTRTVTPGTTRVGDGGRLAGIPEGIGASVHQAPGDDEDEFQKALLLSISDTQSPASAAAASSAAGEDWACSACTLKNSTALLLCEICGSERPSSSLQTQQQQQQQQQQTSKIPSGKAAAAFGNSGNDAVEMTVQKDLEGGNNNDDGQSKHLERGGDSGEGDGTIRKRKRRLPQQKDDEDDVVLGCPQLSPSDLGTAVGREKRDTGTVSASQMQLHPQQSPEEISVKKTSGGGNSAEENSVEPKSGEDTAGSSPAASVATSSTPAPAPRLVREGPLRARYRLRGVLHHLGQHAFAGHYVTDVRKESSEPTSTSTSGSTGSSHSGGKQAGNACGGRVGGSETREEWKRYDDSVVIPVSEATALEGAARRSCYICFYSLE